MIQRFGPWVVLGILCWLHWMAFHDWTGVLLMALCAGVGWELGAWVRRRENAR